MTRGGANLRKLLKINSVLLETVFVVAEIGVEKYDSLSVICSAALFCSLLIVYPIVSCFCCKTVRNVRKTCRFT